MTALDIEINVATMDTQYFTAMSAADQRECFGCVLFGKKRIRRNHRRGGIEVKTATISRDYTIDFFSYQTLATLIHAGRVVEIQK